MRASCIVVVVVVVVVGVVVGVFGCGRSAPPLVACPEPADACDDLIAQQRSIEDVYVGAADDAALRDEAAQCTQLLVEVSLDRECVDGCSELCRLHPCAVVDDDGNRFDPAACAARCAALADEGAIDDDALDEAIAHAAEAPGFCTCRACTAADDALCTRLFDCAIDG